MNPNLGPNRGTSNHVAGRLAQLRDALDKANNWGAWQREENERIDAGIVRDIRAMEDELSKWRSYGD